MRRHAFSPVRAGRCDWTCSEAAQAGAAADGAVECGGGGGAVAAAAAGCVRR